MDNHNKIACEICGAKITTSETTSRITSINRYRPIAMCKTCSGKSDKELEKEIYSQIHQIKEHYGQK